LKRFFESGRLTAAVGDCLDRQWLEQQLVGPTLVVATYLFDSLPHAVVARRAHGLVEIGEGSSERPWGGADLFDHLPLNARCLVPTGALQVLASIAERSPSSVVLTADKGPLDWGHALEAERLRLAQHGEASSISVNFALLRGCGWSHDVWPGSTEAFSVHRIGPGGGAPVFAVSAELPSDALQRVFEAKTGEAVMALPAQADTLMQLADLLRAAPLTEWVAPEQLLAWVTEAVEDAFDVPGDDVPFHGATILQRAGAFDAAADLYRASLRRHGPSVASLMNLATASVMSGDLSQAREALYETLKLDPDHARAAGLLAQLP
jgi:hypothetical protein